MLLPMATVKEWKAEGSHPEPWPQATQESHMSAVQLRHLAHPSHPFQTSYEEQVDSYPSHPAGPASTNTSRSCGGRHPCSLLSRLRVDPASGCTQLPRTPKKYKIAAEVSKPHQLQSSARHGKMVHAVAEVKWGGVHPFEFIDTHKHSHLIPSPCTTPAATRAPQIACALCIKMYATATHTKELKVC